MEKETLPDITVNGGGTVYLVTPQTQRAADWVGENVAEEAMWFGDSLVVEHHYIEDLVFGMREEGLEVE